MLHRVRSDRGLARGLVALVLSLLSLAAAAAQESPRVAIPDAALSEERAIDRLIEQGRKHETAEKWGEALTHYEEALHAHPDNGRLRERFEHSRLHHDVSRRYHDQGFRKAVAALSQRDAENVYREVLLKIDAHYVHRPNWKQLVGQGTQCLEVALSRPEFVREHLAAADAKRIERFTAQLRRTIAGREIRGRSDAQDALTEAARLGEAELGLSAAATILEYTAGAVASLDEYSSYLTGDQLKDVFAQIDGNFVGLGIELKAVDNVLTLVNVIPGSPADKAGLKNGDRIMAVDGRATRSMSTDDAADLLQGAEGSYVGLTVAGDKAASRELRVRREHVDVPSVENVRLVDGEAGIAYMKMTGFQKTTARDLDAALWKLHRQGMKSLILDLRGNPGGLLTASVEAADRFVSEGTIVSTYGRNPQEQFRYSAHKAGTWSVPLVVLIDGDSASASEIFAGAIQDHRRGTIVGQKSYGKGSVQGIFPLGETDGPLRCGVRVTTAKFYAPSGRPISKAGITPDVTVQKTAKPIAEATKSAADLEKRPADTDAALAAAIQTARKQVAQR